ncbi:MAG: hypothetical protein Q8P73_00685 [bacterium]|nr:hypothetical protein [bacterium]
MSAEVSTQAERSVSAARSAAISQSFVQKRFELRSVIATETVSCSFSGKGLAMKERAYRVGPVERSEWELKRMRRAVKKVRDFTLWCLVFQRACRVKALVRWGYYKAAVHTARCGW